MLELTEKKASIRVFIMSAEEEILRVLKKLNKICSGDGTVSEKKND